MNTQSVLAPAVVKSLAHKLRKHPSTPPMSVAQSLEEMSQILGFESWHALQKNYQSAAPTPQSVFANPDFRRDFYTDLSTGVYDGWKGVAIIELMLNAAIVARDNNRKIVCRYLIAGLNANTPFEALLKDLNPHVPFEILAVETGLRNGNLLQGLLEAKEFIA